MTTTALPRRDPGGAVQGTYDLLVIGGGILGTSVTWHAAQAGLRVAMVDGGDFAGATSSASSKLVHGGLRYLQTGNVKLVAENHRERRALAGDMAPHLVKPLTFWCRSTGAARTAPPSWARACSLLGAVGVRRRARPGHHPQPGAGQECPRCAPRGCAPSPSTATTR